MGDACGICGLELATVETRNLLHAGELVRYGEYRGKCVRDASCLQRGYERSQAALAAARRECEAATADRDAWHRTASIRGALLAGDDAPFRKEIANAETECETLREAMLQLRVRDEPDCWCPPRFGRDVKDDEHTTACMMARAALAAPAAGEEGKR